MRALIVFLAGASAALAFAVLAMSPATGDAAKVVWNYSVWGPPRAFTSGIESTKRIMEEGQTGEFELKIHYAGALVPARDYPDSIKIGLIEGGHICPVYYPGKLPLLNVLDLAFLLPGDLRANAAIMDGVLSHPAVEREMERRWNIRYLTVVLMPPFEFMGNVPIASTDDMKGRRMRIPGGMLRILKMFEAVPVMVTAPETYMALDRGTIDVVGFPYSDSFGAFRLYEVSRYVSQGFRISGVVCFAGVSLDAWNALPEEIRQRLPRVRQAAVDTMIRAYDEGDRKWVPIFREKLEFVDFPESERRKMVAKASSLWDEWAREMDDKGFPGTEILEYTMALVAEHSP